MAYNKEKNDQVVEEFLSGEVTENKHLQKQMDIAAQIDTYLKEKGWTKKQLAEKMGFESPSQLTEILAGNANPTLRTLTRFEEVFGKDIIVCPEFYEEDMEAKGWLNPEKVTFLSPEAFQSFVYESGEGVPVNTEWQESIRIKGNEFTSVTEYPTKPSGTNG